MPATMTEPKRCLEPLEEDYTGWYVTRALRRLLRRIHAELGTNCTDAEINILAYLIYKGMSECRSKDWFLKDLRRAWEDETYDPRYGWVATSANQLSDPDRAGVVFCSESKAGELLHTLIAMGLLNRVEDPVHKRYFFYRVDYIAIAEAMREAGESFLLPRVYDEENVNLSALLSVWEQEQEELALAERMEDEEQELDTNHHTAADDCSSFPEEFSDDAADDSTDTLPETTDTDTVNAEEADDRTEQDGAGQHEIEAAALEAAPVVDKPCSMKGDSHVEAGSPDYGDIIDLISCTKNITQTPNTQPPALTLHTTPHPVMKLADRFHDVFRYVPGRKAGIKTAIRDLREKGYVEEDFDAAFRYARWAVKQPGNIENPVGWFKACVMRKFWETDSEYPIQGRSADRTVHNQRKPSWIDDGQKKLSAEEFRAGIERMFREAGLERKTNNRE